MAFNPFMGWTREDLETELRAAQEDYAAGKATVRAGSGEVNIRSEREVSAIARIQQLYRALFAIDPAAYPVAQITPTDRTRGTFWGSEPIWPWP